MKLSILDQSVISSNQTAQDALYESMNLAKVGEELGYSRYWIAEHHDIPGLACPAPEIMLSYIGANTKTIRHWFRSRFVTTLQTLQSCRSL